MRILVSEKLSAHKFKTPEGYLICTDAILSRTGKQEYRRSEIWGDSCDRADEIVQVDRSEEEVFSDKALASFENKPICLEHPEEDVTVSNYNTLAVGFVRDIKRGKADGQDVMLGTLVITDEDAIEAVESGEYTELSCGYDCDMLDEENPQQRNIRGNHVALCQRGRAGIARIVDSELKTVEANKLATGDKVNFRGRKYVVVSVKKNERYNGEVDIELDDNGSKRIVEAGERDKFVIIDSMKDKGVKDMDFSKKTKQGYDVIEMYRDGGRLHVIFKRANDWGIGLGYDTTDGQWAQGMYDFSSLDSARKALGEEKPYARRIQDAVKDDDWTKVEEENYKKANEAPMKDDEESSLKMIELMMRKQDAAIEAGGEHSRDAIRFDQKVRERLNEHTRLYGKSDKLIALMKKHGWSDSLKTFEVSYVKDSVTYVHKVKAANIADAIAKVKDNGHKVVVFTEQALSEMGKNNSIGKYDRVIQAMRSLYSESLLPDDELKARIRKELPRLISKYVKE